MLEEEEGLVMGEMGGEARADMMKIMKVVNYYLVRLKLITNLDILLYVIVQINILLQ